MLNISSSNDSSNRNGEAASYVSATWSETTPKTKGESAYLHVPDVLGSFEELSVVLTFRPIDEWINAWTEWLIEMDVDVANVE